MQGGTNRGMTEVKDGGEKGLIGTCKGGPEV